MTGTELRALRLSAGLSRRELAAQTGISWRSIEAWEQGRRPIPKSKALLVRLVVERAGKKPDRRYAASRDYTLISRVI